MEPMAGTLPGHWFVPHPSKRSSRMTQSVDERVAERDSCIMDAQFLREKQQRQVTARLASLRLGSALLLLSGVLCSLFWTESAHAYAWMIRHDYSACSTCHADPSGGELLTEYGRVTSDLVLRTQYGGTEEESDEKEGEDAEEFEGPSTGLFWGAVDLPKSLLLSGAYRNLYIIEPGADKKFRLIPVMQADLYGQLRLGPVTMGGSVGAGKVPVGSPHVRGAQVTANQGDGMNLISRSHYVGVDIGDSFVLRAGRLNLPFGLRIPEHTTWVREETRSDRESDQQHGLSLAYVGDDLRAEIMAIGGNLQTSYGATDDEDYSSTAIHERGYSMYVEGLGSTRFAAGVTSKVTYSELDPKTYQEKTLRQAHGLTMRWAPHHSVAIMAEADALFRSNAEAGYVGFVQTDWEPLSGFHLLLTGEVLDRGLDDGKSVQGSSPGAGEPRMGGWVGFDWFFYKQLEFRTDVMFRQEQKPTILGQLHFYL